MTTPKQHRPAVLSPAPSPLPAPPTIARTARPSCLPWHVATRERGPNDPPRRLRPVGRPGASLPWHVYAPRPEVRLLGLWPWSPGDRFTGRIMLLGDGHRLFRLDEPTTLFVDGERLSIPAGALLTEHPFARPLAPDAEAWLSPVLSVEVGQNADRTRRIRLTVDGHSHVFGDPAELN